MGVLSDIFARIFPAGHPAVRSRVGFVAPAPAAAHDVPLPAVDVPKVLSALARTRPDKLDWQSSIGDLMRLLGLDATPAGRERLARELNYAGDVETRDRWLHRRVMQLLAAHGGRLPAGLTA
jgi:hypothetical protein